MKTNHLSQLSIADLKNKKKTARGWLVAVGTIIFLYMTFFIVKLATGAWQPNHALGITFLGFLVVLSSIISIQFYRIEGELNKRRTDL